MSRGRFSDRATAKFDSVAYREIIEAHSLPRPPTARQLLLIEMIRRGLSNREIAEQMGLSPRSVTNHIKKLKNRMQVKTRADLGPLLDRGPWVTRDRRARLERLRP